LRYLRFSEEEKEKPEKVVGMVISDVGPYIIVLVVCNYSAQSLNISLNTQTQRHVLDPTFQFLDG
jgi:hypothetical protein